MSIAFRGFIDANEFGRLTFTAQVTALEWSGLEIGAGIQLAALHPREQAEVRELLDCAVAEARQWHFDACAELRTLGKAGA